jgi:DNA-binding SARP family transcriptional activator
MELKILGPVRARVDGPDSESAAPREDDLGGTKPRTMLAVLLLARDGAVCDDRLGELLWGSRPPATAVAQLHTYASRLRRVLGPEAPLLRVGRGYRMISRHVRSDYAEFLRLTAEGRLALTQGRPERAAPQLRAALGLWRGDALTDVTPQLAAAERPRLEELQLEALEARTEADLMLGEYARLVCELTGLVARYPLRERLRAQLMMALCRSGRQADSLDVYRAGRRMLNEELGVEPGQLLNDTHHAVLAGGVEPAGAR